MKLFYREIGTGGENMIILHGLFGSPDNWLTQAKMFAKHFHVYLPDLRNHGQSPHSEEFSYTLLADDMEAFIRRKGISQPVVIGHSMGGKTAMTVATRYPDSVHRLIVVDIAPKAYPEQHDRILEGLLALPVGQLGSRNEAEEKLAEYVPEGPVRQFLLKNLKREKNGGFGWKMNLEGLAANISAIGDAVEKGIRFEKPTLFIRGRKSNYIKDSDMDSIRKVFPNATLVTMDTGHWVQAEKPGELVEVVLDFLGRAETKEDKTG